MIPSQRRRLSVVVVLQESLASVVVAVAKLPVVVFCWSRSLKLEVYSLVVEVVPIRVMAIYRLVVLEVPVVVMA